MYPFIPIGQFQLPAYGLLVALGFLAAVWITGRLGRRCGLNRESAMNLAVYAALVGIVGAKALMIALDFGYYAANPLALFSFSTLQAGWVFTPYSPSETDLPRTRRSLRRRCRGRYSMSSSGRRKYPMFDRS